MFSFITVKSFPPYEIRRSFYKIKPIYRGIRSDLMKRKEIILTLSIIFTLFFLTSKLSVNQVKSESSISGRDSMSIASSSIAISIHNDVELESYSVSGDGGSSTPFIIRDLDIDTGSTIALRIEDTTKHFEIRNCTLTAMYGIYLDNVTGGTSRIENNTVYDCNSVAIYLLNTNGSWIVDNILYKVKSLL